MFSSILSFLFYIGCKYILTNFNLVILFDPSSLLIKIFYETGSSTGIPKHGVLDVSLHGDFNPLFLKGIPIMSKLRFYILQVAKRRSTS